MKTIIGAALTIALCVPFVSSAQEGKDLCLVNSANCVQSVQNDSFQEKISKLENEISKGQRVYTKEELDLLEKKLNDYKSLQAALISG